MSNSISVQAVVIIFIIILIIAGLTAWYCNPDSHDKSRWYIFIVTLAALGIILTFFFYYSLVEIQDEQHKLDVVEETQQLSRDITDITSKSMVKKLHSIPHFIMSLNPVDFPHNKYGKYKSDRSNINSSISDIDDTEDINSESYNKIHDRSISKYEQKILIHALSHEIFCVWQEAMFYKDFTKVREEEAYLILFLQWANSRQLYREWCKHRMSYSKETIIFGNLLFKYGLRIREQNTQSYLDAIDRLMCSDDYIYLFC